MYIYILERLRREVLKGINTYFKEKEISNKKITLTKNSANLQITKYSDICNIIIPFFNEYPILGMKSLDFEDFKKICFIVKKAKADNLKSELFINEIIKIKSGMNLNRK